MLFVPESMRGRGVGTALLAAAETEARSRNCLGISVDTLSFQAAPFYEKLGFSIFGVLDDCPPGHRRLFFQKRLVPAGPA
jgi:GNAT superfamily N-acetyltransferase